jgi:hypothetical protein
MIQANIRYKVQDTNQVYINLNDLLQLLEDGEEELRFISPDASKALEKLEQTMLNLGIHALTGATKDTIDSITRML